MTKPLFTNILPPPITGSERGNGTDNVSVSTYSKPVKGFDILKIIMACVIVDIHAGVATYYEGSLLGDILRTINDVAVPVFFVISSFFFFRKIRYGGKPKREYLMSFEKRINKLYIFWIIVLSPVILLYWHREYLESSLLTSVCLFIKNYLFAYQFGASWYLGALIVGIPVTYCLLKLFKGGFMWILPLIVYLYIRNANPEEGLFHWYETTLRTPLLSFPHALLWLAIGYYISNETFLQWNSRVSPTIHLLVFLASMVGGVLCFEYFYLISIPAVISIVLFMYKINLSVKESTCRRLRINSTHIYCMHFTVIVLCHVLPYHECRPLVLLTAIIVCMLCSEAMIRMMKLKSFSWLKYSY